MDDQEDDARYPLNPYHSIHRSKLPFRNSTFPPENRRRFPENDEEDDDQNIINQSTEEEKEDDDEFDGEDSSESRGKKRKLDELALAFEFAPRAAATPPVPARNPPTDWSERSTFVLLEAWGDRYIHNGRNSLRPNEWIEVSKNVSKTLKISLSNSQCQNRLGTLKKKYKKEKARMAESVNLKSKWIYFKMMDELISPPSPPRPVSRQHLKLPCGVDAEEFVFTSSRVYLNRSNDMNKMASSPGYSESEDEEESDGFPPMKRSSLFGMLADSVMKFGEIYERIGNSKRQQMAELERMRKEFQRDLEVHKRKILERAKAEIEKIRQGGDGEEDDDESLSG